MGLVSEAVIGTKVDKVGKVANLIRPCYADGLRPIKIFVGPCCDVVLQLRVPLLIVMRNECDMVNNKAVCEGDTKFPSAARCQTSQIILSIASQNSLGSILNTFS